jgi:hypothetical protein
MTEVTVHDQFCMYNTATGLYLDYFISSREHSDAVQIEWVISVVDCIRIDAENIESMQLVMRTVLSESLSEIPLEDNNDLVLAYAVRDMLAAGIISSITDLQLVPMVYELGEGVESVKFMARYRRGCNFLLAEPLLECI